MPLIQQSFWLCLRGPKFCRRNKTHYGTGVTTLKTMFSIRKAYTRSVAATRAALMPGSPAAWPASWMISKRASGQAR